MRFMLLLSVGLIATCGLIYELIAGAIASYLLGDSITQFSIVIGCYLFAMGVGSYLAQFIRRGLIRSFIRIEIAVGLIGGLSAPIMFYLFEHGVHFPVVLYSTLFIIGLLVGCEIPLLLRILRHELEFNDLISRVLSLDYLGALVASICFPLLFIPTLGFVKTALFFGLVNVGIALISILMFEKTRPQLRWLRFEGIVALLVLLLCFMNADGFLQDLEQANYHDRVVYNKATSYQKLTVTHQDDDVRLFINGNLQFSSRDEYRYHEALVHMVMQRHANPENIVVLGGGDGMAVREILKYPSVKQIHLVDLDQGMTALFRDHQLLAPLNQLSLRDPKVTIVNQDAFRWLQESKAAADVVIIDFPDPSNFALGKLYSLTFYQTLNKLLKPDSLFVVQSTSPLFARRAFWCVVNTVEQAGYTTIPYHAYVPSFGEWGFVLGSLQAVPELRGNGPQGLRFFSKSVADQMVQFPADMSRTYGDGVNRLNNQNLVHIFESEWQRYVGKF